jgi:NodT family efflux transporter outer membrane factor (OMF) lipoprotein
MTKVMGIKSCLMCALALIMLSACAGGLVSTVGPDYARPDVPVAASWQTAQPPATKAHHANPANLKRWWQQFNDPALSQFLAAAQKESATVADARARIEQARAGMVGAIGQGMPRLDGQADMLRSENTFGGPVFEWDRYQVGLQSTWEVDLFGGIARQREAALGQLQARHDTWHDARIALAVEVANAYLGFRYCEALVRIAEADADSRQASARLTDIAGSAGLRAPADVALAHASAADSRDNLIRQHTQCERAVKGLVFLTGLSEVVVRHRLTGAPDQTARLPTPPPFRLEGMPAGILLQRPDVAASEREVAEASAKIGVEEAKRYPRLSLSGNITPTLQSINGAALYLAHTWSIGPTLNLPLFDSIEAAKIQYQAATLRFRSVVRTAVKEVEDALVRLQSCRQRLPEARAAEAGYQKNFEASNTLYRVGFGSLIDLEASRRQTLIARRTVAELEQEQVAAWIALYRAAGGGWDDGTDKQPTLRMGDDPSTPFNLDRFTLDSPS